MRTQLLAEELIQERYPNIAFHLTFTPFDPIQAQDPPNISLQTVDLDALEILYIYGLGLGGYFTHLSAWLQKGTSTLIFLEDSLAALSGFLQSPLAAEILSHPRIHIRFISEKKEWASAIEDLAQTFPSDRIDCIALKPRLRLKLMRASAAIHALFAEALYPHRLFSNIWPNIQRIPEAFFANGLQGQFENIPAIICGAGPSLEKSIPDLKKLSEKALIISGGSALAALMRSGVTPHLAMALDPNQEELDRFLPVKGFSIPFLYANRLLPAVFETCKGPIGYLRSDTGGAAETWLEEKLGIIGEPIGPDLGREAFSVTTLAIAYAYALGCNPIILTGVDLAYTGMRRYASGVMESSAISIKQLKKDPRITEKVHTRRDIFGKPAHTLLKWIMESTCIGAYAKANPERLFLNATEGGIGFPGIENIPLSQIAEKHCLQSSNLHGKIALAIEKNRMRHITPRQIQSLGIELKTSLMRCQQMARAMLDELDRIAGDPALPLETGQIAILQSDFGEETAFSALFPALPAVLDQFLERASASEDRNVALEKKKTKWNYMLNSIVSFLETLK